MTNRELKHLERKTLIWYKCAVLVAGLVTLNVFAGNADLPGDFVNPMLVFAGLHVLYHLLLHHLPPSADYFFRALWRFDSAVRLVFAAYVLRVVGPSVPHISLFFPLVFIGICLAQPAWRETAYFAVLTGLSYSGASLEFGLQSAVESNYLYTTVMGALFLFAGVLVVRQLTTLRELATTDKLTGLKNRRYFSNALTEEMSRSARYGYSLTLVMIDLDGFKVFNDHLGHPVGDQLLKRVADTLVENIRTHDIACRVGGDEFALILPQTEPQAAKKVVDRLHQRIRAIEVPQPTTAFNHDLSISVGLAAYPHHAKRADELMTKADRALVYGAKGSSERVVVYREGIERKEKNRPLTESYRSTGRP